MTLEEMKKATGGKGAFSVAVTNGEDRGIRVDVSVSVSNLPPSYKHLACGYGYTKCVYIKAHETVIVELPVPLISSQDLDGYDDYVKLYDNTENLLSLPEDSLTSVRVVRTTKKHCFEVKTFKSSYLEETRLVKLPDEVAITLNCDDRYLNPIPLSGIQDLFVIPISK